MKRVLFARRAPISTYNKGLVISYLACLSVLSLKGETEISLF